ncbi:phenylalanine--tRNA ligase subunit alpha [Candidatus Pacearchaeota archaeon]|jgi:phenylalanyl-tRNA synthetase alpha chain|nr:phenylalanine--tRNA ligase subunit alpha [Candidatus Pacearchaeota archaeon]|tara:strand:- start:14719 stop:16218 length:1500 start_codon:yes stop_codon:yes gene_type:complete
MNIKNIIKSLSPNERKVIPYLKEEIDKISEKSGLDKVSVLRSLEYLQNKNIINLSKDQKKIIEIGINGALYRKRGLPERRLLNILSKKRILLLQDAQKQSSLSNEEFKASLGALKKKAIIELKNKKIILNTSDITKKMLEETFLEALPIEYDSLSQEQQYSLKSLQNRKDIIEIKEEKIIKIKITDLGKTIINSGIKPEPLIEQLTPEILKKESLWKGKKFRRYDVTSPLPIINGGKRHFVNQAVDYGRKIWTEMGFTEMTGNIIQSSFWNFDSLFTAQDHPVREMQDTFFIDKKRELPDKTIVKAVKLAHEKGVSGSKGWRYSWDLNEAKKLVLRTHTTCLSAQTLSKLKEKKGKFFAIGKVFRNETIDWSHGFEFYQTDGIVIDKNVNFRHLLGYLLQFYKKMGFKKIKFTPAYFPYTEPSVEINAWHPERKVWLELGGAGIFRPEITIPLIGENIPVLAWGLGFDRIITDYYKIKDLREMYKNNITQLRKMKFWIK